MTLTLFHITHSPWSVKARTALHHHALAPALIEYAAFISEPALRLRIAHRGGRFWGRVTVPVLFTASAVLRQSWEIALWTDEHGHSAALIPLGEREAIAEWDRRSDRFLTASRARFVLKVRDDEAALRELVPPAISGLPLPLLRASLGRFAAKYRVRAEDEPRYRDSMRAQLSAVRDALADGRDYLTGSFSYADIAIAVALRSLQPTPGTSFGPACEAIAGDAALAKEFRDLLDYRDRLLARHPLA